jgi:hypothetical protein
MPNRNDAKIMARMPKVKITNPFLFCAGGAFDGETSTLNCKEQRGTYLGDTIDVVGAFPKLFYYITPKKQLVITAKIE